MRAGEFGSHECANALQYGCPYWTTIVRTLCVTCKACGPLPLPRSALPPFPQENSTWLPILGLEVPLLPGQEEPVEEANKLAANSSQYTRRRDHFGHNGQESTDCSDFAPHVYEPTHFASSTYRSASSGYQPDCIAYVAALSGHLAAPNGYVPVLGGYQALTGEYRPVQSWGNHTQSRYQPNQSSPLSASHYYQRGLSADYHCDKFPLIIMQGSQAQSEPPFKPQPLQYVVPDEDGAYELE